MSNIVQDAKHKIYNSKIMLYVSPEKIEEAFTKIYVYDNKDEFLREFGRSGWSGERLEGFNRNNGSYLGPDATVHTVIHEVLHGISSEFDEQGHRIKNGIMGDGSLQFANQINEGITDYLATKLSGEAPRHYIQGHKLFSKLGPMLEKYTKDPNILMQIYLTNDVKFLHDFLNYYGKDNTFENLYENFLFMKDEELYNVLGKVEKNLNKDLKKRERKEKRNNFFNKLKNIFTNNSEKQKLLTDGSEHQNINVNGEEKLNSHEQFVNQYDINNFESAMTQEDILKFKEYQQDNIKENQQQYSNENERYE